MPSATVAAGMMPLLLVIAVLLIACSFFTLFVVCGRRFRFSFVVSSPSRVSRVESSRVEETSRVVVSQSTLKALEDLKAYWYRLDLLLVHGTVMSIK